MIGRARVLAFLGSAMLHVGAVAAVLALATSLRQPEPLFVDLTGASPAGDERAALAGETRGSKAAVPPARQARRMSEQAPRAPELSAPVPPASFSASREAAPADQTAPSPAAEPTAAHTDAGTAREVSSDMPAHSGA